MEAHEEYAYDHSFTNLSLPSPASVASSLNSFIDVLLKVNSQYLLEFKEDNLENAIGWASYIEKVSAELSKHEKDEQWLSSTITALCSTRFLLVGLSVETACRARELLFETIIASPFLTAGNNSKELLRMVIARFVTVWGGDVRTIAQALSYRLGSNSQVRSSAAHLEALNSRINGSSHPTNAALGTKGGFLHFNYVVSPALKTVYYSQPLTMTLRSAAALLRRDLEDSLNHPPPSVPAHVSTQLPRTLLNSIGQAIRSDDQSLEVFVIMTCLPEDGGGDGGEGTSDRDSSGANEGRGDTNVASLLNEELMKLIPDIILITGSVDAKLVDRLCGLDAWLVAQSSSRIFKVARLYLSHLMMRYKKTAAMKDHRCDTLSDLRDIERRLYVLSHSSPHLASFVKEVLLASGMTFPFI